MDGEGTIPRIHPGFQIPPSGVFSETYSNSILIALVPMWSDDGHRSIEMMEVSKNNARRMMGAGGRNQIGQGKALQATSRPSWQPTPGNCHGLTRLSKNRKAYSVTHLHPGGMWGENTTGQRAEKAHEPPLVVFKGLL